MTTDVLIVLIFIVFALFLQHAIKQEAIHLDVNNRQITDFSVRIKGFPPNSRFSSKETLKAKLALHLEKVL